MKIVRVFPRKTHQTPRDDYAFVGDPPMAYLLPDWSDIEAVHVSVTFSWDIKEGRRLAMAWSHYHPNISLGGPAFSDPADGFTPGLYIQPDITFTSRGCNNQCPWCLVPEREGRLRELEDFAPGRVVEDNNLLQCNQWHQDRVFEMLRKQALIHLSGGLDPRLVTDEVVKQLQGLRIRQLFLACDIKEAIGPLRKAAHKLQDLPRQKLRCYVLLAFGNETVSEATARLEDVWAAGCMPFAQLYQPPDRYIRYSREWRDLARTFSRPAATKAYIAQRNTFGKEF